MIKSIIYISRVKDSFFEEAIQLMLLQARIFNRRNGITGCLMHHRGYFVQLMEGEGSELERLYGRIKGDQRHYDVTTLWEGKCKDRLYKAWSMAYHDSLDKQEEIRYNSRLLEAFYDLAVVTPENKELMDSFTEVTRKLVSEEADTLIRAS